MKLELRIAVFAFLLQASANALPEDPVEYAAWEVRQISAIRELELLPREQSIPQLGALVHKLSLHTHTEKGDRLVYNRARSLLLSIPDHAKWFGDEIKRMIDNDVNGTGLTIQGQKSWHFETLSQLPSPETVAVLGELLFDERDPWKNIPTDATWYPGCHFSVLTLHKLGLENPPVNSTYADPRNDLRTWQLWFEQVRAGTRTFSFKGDKTVYSLSGPVAAARDPGPVVLEERALDEPLGIDSVASAPPRIPSLIALALALLALLLAATRAFRRRNA